MNTLAPQHVEFFVQRGISPETATRFEVYTGAVVGKPGERHVEPSARGNVIAYPFFEHGQVVNEKYRAERDGEKFFWHRKGGKRTFWNSDVLDDPQLEAGTQALVIAEGFEDAMVAIDCGWPLTVSVPDGAPPVPKDGRMAPLDPETEHTGKFEFLWLNRDRLRRIKRFILAVDDDGPGQRLAAEIVRRLGAARCMFVTYPEGCKDLNDVLRKHGREAVHDVLRTAKQYPVRGLYRLSEYPALPALQPISIGWPLFDGSVPGNGWMKLFAGEFMVVTGIPSHGKSTWVLNMLWNTARDYGWRAAIFSPEMPTVPYLRDKLRRIIGGDDADRLIESNFVFIDNDPNDADEDDITLEWIIEKARDAVLRDGINVLVIDPWNEIEHARLRDETTTEYVGRAIRRLKRFGRQYEVAVIVLAHPTKDVFEHGKARTATLYDIEGSAHWFNKCDHGVVIERAPEGDQATVHIAKVRFDETGFKGAIRMQFEVRSQRYRQLSEQQEFPYG
ncbi:DnaB-like helicase C-terminal domain-containing protein [Bradyrhizobium sp. CB82]|uniref:DnaB-like helicase C-terminal domain-containing protein n=1 Tax=Bradyrhizobium sp. CB82 TaxID=3039159 RepID=UPI0024B213BF|nr:DnaB-like helicase C-terminal domain-containing protein [Bradyrhizobium sp. CB82]WFU42572.1 DnaB-like helicase C-terminal domain-containing protein [Bradyrhizobium sp. CB82]